MLTGDFKDERLRAIEAEPPVIYDVTKADLLSVPACAVCGGDPYVLARVFMGELEVFTTVVCLECSYVWRAVTPDAAWFKCAARKLSRRDGSIDIGALSLEDKRFMAYQRRMAFLAPYAPDGALALDVGAALGSGVEVLLDEGFQVTALEADEHRAALLHEYCVRVIASTIEDALQDGCLDQYELIVASHVLEHCRDPLYVLSGLARHLVLGSGVMYVEVPSWGIINWSDAFYLAHMSNFSTLSFCRLANQAGLTVLDTVQFVHEDNRIDLGFALAAMAGKDTPFAWLPVLGTLQALYRKGLDGCNISGGLRYRVPCFDHYNYGLRFNRYTACQRGDTIELEVK